MSPTALPALSHVVDTTAELARFVTASSGSGHLVMAATGDLEHDTEARTLRGIVVPYGKSGATSGGRLTFKAGSLSVSDPSRVKLLREHAQTDVVLGYGVSFEDTDAGLMGTFHLPEDPEGHGTRALFEATNKLRDGFSVGVELDDATLTKLRRSQGAPVDGRGQLREVSLVSVPAFDDARMAASADLVVTRWETTTAAGSPGTTTTTGRTTPTMTEDQRRRLSELLTARASRDLTTPEATELDELLPLATAAGLLNVGAPAADAQAGAGVTVPEVVPAVAGAATVTASPSTYDFSRADGGGLIRDMYLGATRRDSEAQARVDAFNAELRDHNPASVMAFVTAAATRDNVDGAGTDLPDAFGGQLTYRPDLMRQLVDIKRPFLSRIPRTPISNAQPFAIPTVGEFEGVGDHTEGTPHRPAGTLTLGAGDAVQPTATSGAWEVSRELLDAANPVLDRIAVRAMLRDYQRKSEGKFITLLNTLAADAGVHRYGVSTAMGLRDALLDFVNDDEEAADIAGLSKALLRTIMADVDANDRAQIPFVGHTNAVGTMAAGYTGVTIDGVPMFRAARLDAGVTGANVAGGVGVLARSEGLLWAESAVQQFRFDEVLGPGVVKFALWAYNGAAILDTEDVAIINSGADPTP